MKVSVIVPALNAARTLPQCLEALARQTRAPDEVIVADNGSNDDTAALARSFPGLPIRVVDAGRVRRGPGRVRNAGSLAASGDILAFTDADCVPAPEWIAAIVTACEGGAVAVVGSVTADAPSTTPEILQALITPLTVTKAMTNSFAIRADLFREIGRFDERLEWLEDTAISLKLERAGHPLTLVPAARVAHHVPSNVDGLFRRGWKYGKQSAPFFELYFPHRLLIEATKHIRVDVPLPFGQSWILLSPDKIVLLSLLPGVVFPPLLLLAAVPLTYYYVDTFRRASQRNLKLGPFQAAAVLGLNLAYHWVQTCGRARSSLLSRTLCL